MISIEEVKARREALFARMAVGDCAVIPAAKESIRNRDTHYPFRQNSDFHYLTLFPEPEAVLVLFRGETAGETFLFNRPRDLAKEMWTGPRVGQDDAVKIYHVDKAWNVAECDTQIPLLFQRAKRILYTLGVNHAFDHRILKWLNTSRAQQRAGINSPREFIEIDAFIHELRLKKSASEIALMRKAAEISAKSHCLAMQTAKPGIHEYQLEAVMLQHFIANGCRFQAYESIVGSGKNACVLHYTDNRDLIHDGDLILIDAAAEHQNYAADITRTFPVNGKFSPAQAAVYDIVLNAQLAAINLTKSGTPWNEMQALIIKIMTQGLVDLDILKGPVDSLIEKKAYLPFYMHNSGHWLGLDVHDVGSYKSHEGQWRTLEPGMVLTVEPGLYIRPSDIVPKEFWNIGIRIEDDVLVTDGEPDILSRDVPKQREQIERLMQQ